MQSPLSLTAPCDPQQAQQWLASKLEQALKRHVPLEEPKLTRLEVPVNAPAPLAWLRAQQGVTQYYWAERDGDFVMAGIGEAEVVCPAGGVDLLHVFQHLRSRLSSKYPSLRFYGGFRFSPAQNKNSRWSQFKAYRFVVPRIELIKRPSGTFLACNFVSAREPAAQQALLRTLLEDLKRIVWEEPPAPSVISVIRREDLPTQEGWERMVERALDACAQHKLEKVVLARETTFETAERLNPVAVLQQLAACTPDSFEFCFHPVQDRAFIGASPERLFKRHNVYLQSEALAGTRPRGRTPEEDARLGEALLNSDKELREHRFVLRMLREHFRHYCIESREAESPSLLRLRHCQHLYTPIEGILRDPDCDAYLMNALHPTPAVGGTPRDLALAWIDAEEPFDRGIYAAPVGWVGYDGCEFCVAIRSALIKDNLLSVYTGAGIVPGSHPTEEWTEIEHKMGSFLDILRQYAD